MMRNIEATVTGKILTLKIDLSENLGPSGSGKTLLVASTGRAEVVGKYEGKEVFLGLNAYTYPDAKGTKS